MPCLESPGGKDSCAAVRVKQILSHETDRDLSITLVAVVGARIKILFQICHVSSNKDTMILDCVKMGPAPAKR